MIFFPFQEAKYKEKKQEVITLIELSTKERRQK